MRSRRRIAWVSPWRKLHSDLRFATGLLSDGILGPRGMRGLYLLTTGYKFELQIRARSRRVFRMASSLGGSDVASTDVVWPWRLARGGVDQRAPGLRIPTSKPRLLRCGSGFAAVVPEMGKIDRYTKRHRTLLLRRLGRVFLRIIHALGLPLLHLVGDVRGGVKLNEPVDGFGQANLALRRNDFLPLFHPS
jgi:hypothetical protein